MLHPWAVHAWTIQNIENFPPYDRAMFLLSWRQIRSFEFRGRPDQRNIIISPLKSKKWPIIRNNLETVQNRMLVGIIH